MRKGGIAFSESGLGRRFASPIFPRLHCGGPLLRNKSSRNGNNNTEIGPVMEMCCEWLAVVGDGLLKGLWKRGI